VESLEAVADRGYFNGEEILACEQADITVTLPKPMTSGAKSEGRFGKQLSCFWLGFERSRCSGATSACVADEIGKICSQTSPSHVALQLRAG
jgi:hypothetical protein